MSKYTKKPVEIEAVQWNGEITQDLLDLAGDKKGDCSINFNDRTLAIQTLEGVMTANVGDFIIKGVKDELYPCKPDIFYATYDISQNREIDRIRKLDVEKMAEFLTDFDCFKSCEHDGSCKTRSNCVSGLKKYLEMEVVDEK